MWLNIFEKFLTQFLFITSVHHYLFVSVVMYFCHNSFEIRSNLLKFAHAFTKMMLKHYINFKQLCPFFQDLPKSIKFS